MTGVVLALPVIFDIILAIGDSFLAKLTAFNDARDSSIFCKETLGILLGGPM